MTRTLPGEVAEARRALSTLLRRLDPGAAEPDTIVADGTARPVVALVAAPGRGRWALAAALLGVATLPRRTRRVVHGQSRDEAGGDDVSTAAVPLLEEFDLALPARGEDGTWTTAGASALLVLADAGAPLDRDELAALVDAAARVEVVVFALVRTDAHRGWRTVLDADRELVAEHVPRLADASWFPVSAELARRAAGTRTECALAAGTAEALRRASGIAPLQRSLHHLVARRRRMLDEANALRRLASRLSCLAEPDPAVPDPRTPAPREADPRRGRHVRWRTGLAAARIAAVDDLGVRVRALSSETRRRVDSVPRAELAEVPRRLAGELETTATEVVAGLGADLRGLVADTLADLLDPQELAAMRIPPPRPVPPTTVPTSRSRPPEDRMLVVLGASGGLGLSRLALLPLLAAPVVPAVLGAALVPVSVGLGVGAAGWLVHARRVAADRAHLRQWAGEALAAARGDLERVLAEALVSAEREVTLALDEALDRRNRAAAARPAIGAGTRTADRDAAREGAARAEALLARMEDLVRRAP